MLTLKKQRFLLFTFITSEEFLTPSYIIDDEIAMTEKWIRWYIAHQATISVGDASTEQAYEIFHWPMNIWNGIDYDGKDHSVGM